MQSIDVTAIRGAGSTLSRGAADSSASAG